MSSTSDTSAIDEKKAENEEIINKGDANYSKFFTNIIIVIIILFFHFTISGLVLYGCKVAQSNILPTEEDCVPYTDDAIKLEEIKCNIFNTILEEPPLSMKISFPYNKENSKNLLIDFLYKYKISSKAGVVPNYFISIIEKLLQANYSSYNVFLNFFNNAPELINVILGPIIMTIFTMCLLFFNIFYAVYLWFTEMKWFFKENSEKGNSRPKWSNISDNPDGSYTTSILLSILFTILFFVGLPILPVFPMIALGWVLLSIITYGSKMNVNADGSDKSTSSFTVIKELFARYKVTISTLLSIVMIMSAFGNLGATQGIICLVVVLLAYLGILSIDIFNPIKLESHLTPLVSYDQAKKQCMSQNSSVNKSKKPEHGFLYNLIYGQNGGSLKKELKKLSKQL